MFISNCPKTLWWQQLGHRQRSSRVKKPDLIVFCSTSFCNHKQVHAFIRACIVKITMLHEPNFSFYMHKGLSDFRKTSYWTREFPTPLIFSPAVSIRKENMKWFRQKNTNNDKYSGESTGVCPKQLARYVFRTGGIKVGHINNYFKKPLDKGPCLWKNFYVLIGNVWKAVSLEFTT